MTAETEQGISMPTECPPECPPECASPEHVEYTLADRLAEIRRGSGLPVGYFRETARLAADTAVALQSAHEAGMFHGSIDPSTIYIDAAGRPAPAGLRAGRAGDDRRTDVLGLGCVLFEMLTLVRPPPRSRAQSLIGRLASPGPPDPRRLNRSMPRDLAAICMRAMERRPARRYGSMEELADDLGRFLSGDAVAAEPSSTAGRLWLRARRRPLPAAAALLGLAAAAAALVVLGLSYPRVLQERNSLARLADAGLLESLRSEEARLWPAEPSKSAGMEAWIEQARDLSGRLDLHRRALEDLRARALPAASPGAGLEDLAFRDPADQWRHAVLADLVAGIGALADPRTGALRGVEERLAFARSIQRASIESHRAAWDAAAASIADTAQCPRYGGLELAPQLGLVPLGRDPASGLWEFAHLQAGRVPERDADGRLIVDGESGLVFVLIPGGSFQMGAERPSDARDDGSPNADPQAEDDEAPVRAVELRPFFLSKYEMTQGQWYRFTGKNPSGYAAGRSAGDREITGAHPVESVSWAEAAETLFRLGIRLPSEAEWEYAARAGTGSVWWTGDYPESLARAANLGDISREQSGRGATAGGATAGASKGGSTGTAARDSEHWLLDGYAAHAPADAFRPNPFGLHGICGNVWEWCRDRYHATYRGAPADGSAREEPGSDARVFAAAIAGGDVDLRVFRGGGWDNPSRHCRSANRSRGSAEFRYHNLGVRPARSIDD